MSAVLSVTKNSRKEELWISCLSLLTNENVAEAIGSSKILVLLNINSYFSLI